MYAGSESPDKFILYPLPGALAVSSEIQATSIIRINPNKFERPAQATGTEVLIIPVATFSQTFSSPYIFHNSPYPAMGDHIS